jgi:thiazole synthase
VTITLNGEPFELDQPLSVTDLLARLEIDPRRVAVEHNLTIIKRHTYTTVVIGEGDRLEIVNAVGGGSIRSIVIDTPFVIAGRTFSSRLIVGTGKYPSHPMMRDCHTASGADMVTVAVRRVNISDRSRESLLDYIDTDRIFILPNTAGCYTAEEAIRTARLGREAGLSNWVKLEVIGDERTLFPTTRRSSKPRAFWCPKASWCCPTPTTTRSPAASSKRRAPPP